MKGLVDGEELNGMELWRVLFVQNEGGAHEVEIADLGALQAFPQCPSGNDLQQYLGEWLTLVQEQGRDLPPRHLTTLLLKMLPSEVHADVKRKELAERALYGYRRLPPNRHDTMARQARGANACATAGP